MNFSGSGNVFLHENLQEEALSLQEQMGYIGSAPLGALLVVLFSGLWVAAVRLIWRPYIVTRFFRKQGVRGPPYRFWSGSLAEVQRMRNAAADLILDSHCHDITTRVFPHVRKFTAEYGETYLIWFGAEPMLEIIDPEMVKQVLSNKFGFFPKLKPSPALLPLLGTGLVLTTGADWARHRTLLKPAFTMDKLKLSTRTIGQCAKATFQLWQDQVNEEEDGQKEVEVSAEFQGLTADVIAHVAFGSSYKEGKEVFLAQKRLQVMAAQAPIRGNFSGSNWLPTRKNLEKWKLERIVRNNIKAIIKSRLDREREDSSGYGNDLLGLMLEANQKGQGTQILSMDEIIDECRTFFFTGHETTSLLLTWAVFLLSINQDWQEKLRKEVVHVCGVEIPNPDMLGKLKLVHMVLLETLRLYSPIYLMSRKASKDMTIGNIQIPKDTRLMIPVPMVHRNKRIWGADADEFQPLRFQNGIFKAAAHPNALVAFSLGPRVCIGQDFAMLEAKTVLAMMLQRFSFSLSPKYKHAPNDGLTIQPKFGVLIILRQVHA